MLILALDTTTRAGSSALARDGVIVREEASDPAQPPAARLPADLMSLLEDAGVTLDAIDLFAVATGPGSFTGLRIGIATMQGLAFATGKPLIGVSGMDALAAIATTHYPLPTTQRVATLVDAWRGEVYATLYEGGREIEPPTVSLPGPLIERWGAREITFIGDGAATFRDLIVSTLGERARIAEPAAPMLAGKIAQLAADVARTGELPLPHAIRPLYVRRPDVELLRDRA
jgi:tRNA threonylcarbamoyladenosine biosynthesis protein TsaB